MFSIYRTLRFFRWSSHRFLLILGLSVAFSAQATPTSVTLDELLKRLPVGTSVSLIAKNLDTDQILIEHQSQTFMLPASTQKVFTALAAKLTLPDDFRFQTALLTNGKQEKSRLKGDLIVKFTGDPTLTRTQLSALVSQLKTQGISHITGNLVLDTSVFASHNKASGWVWNDLSLCFNAPPAAVNIDHNCFFVNLDANQPSGSLMAVDVPAVYPVSVVSSAYVADKSEVPYCLLDVVVGERNRYQIKGCLARQTKPFGLSFAVQDPNAYGADMLKAELKRQGIEFNGQLHFPTQPQTGQVLAVHYSEPLADLIKKMMKKSDNQIADTLFRTLANQVHKRAGTFPLASKTLRHILTAQGIEFGNSVIADGSGLSRHNQINAHTMLQALTLIAEKESQLNLLASFPIAGVDGTLAGRSSVTAEPLAHNVIAKTGALKGVYNLAGFMKNVRGERIAFVQFINGYATSENAEAKTKRAPLNQFENAFFMMLYNQ